MKDYEQLYYDEVYKNRKLESRVRELENELYEINMCRTKKNIDLQKYLVLQIKNYKFERIDEYEKNKNINNTKKNNKRICRRNG